MVAKRENRTFEEYLLESLQDPEEAQVYLNLSLEEYIEDGDFQMLLHSLRTLASAKGGILELFETSEPDQESLRVLLDEDPKLGWHVVLAALGFELVEVSVEHAASF